MEEKKLEGDLEMREDNILENSVFVVHDFLQNASACWNGEHTLQ